jgi:hypothetical protein
MSLKAFHLVFIIASILLAAGFATWAIMDYFSPGGRLYELLAGLGSIVVAIALIFYERYFLKKTKDISYL